MEAVSNDRFDVKAALQHHRHFVPGLIHLAAVNTFDRQHVEDDLVPVNGHGFGRDAEHCNFSSVTHVVNHVPKRGRVAGHLEANVEPFNHPKLFLHLTQVSLASVPGDRRAHFPG
jgi:hypothetical protein